MLIASILWSGLASAPLRVLVDTSPCPTTLTVCLLPAPLHGYKSVEPTLGAPGLQQALSPQTLPRPQHARGPGGEAVGRGDCEGLD